MTPLMNRKSRYDKKKEDTETAIT